MEKFYTLSERRENTLCMLCAKGDVAEADKFVNPGFPVPSGGNSWFICGACVSKLGKTLPEKLMKHFDPVTKHKFELACSWYAKGLSKSDWV